MKLEKEQNLMKLNQTLGRIDERLKKQVSLRHNFLLSAVRGLGYSIGGTVALAVVIAILSRFLAAIRTAPIIESWLDQQTVEQLREVRE